MSGGPPRQTRSALLASLVLAVLAFAASASAAVPGGEFAPAGAQGEPASRSPAAPAAINLEDQPIKRTRPAAPAAPATQKTAARAPTTSAGGLDVKRVVMALAVVIILILLVRVLGKQFFGVTGVRRTTRAVQVMSRSPYSPRHEIVTLRIGRRLLVLADGGGQVNTLSEITDPDEVAAFVGQLQDDHTDRAAPTFRNLFGKHRRKYDDADADPEAADPQPDAHDGAIAGRLGARGHGDAGYTEADDAGADHPAVTSTRQELSGLMDKVRLLSSQYKS